MFRHCCRVVKYKTTRKIFNRTFHLSFIFLWLKFHLHDQCLPPVLHFHFLFSVKEKDPKMADAKSGVCIRAMGAVRGWPKLKAKHIMWLQGQAELNCFPAAGRVRWLRQRLRLRSGRPIRGQYSGHVISILQWQTSAAWHRMSSGSQAWLCGPTSGAHSSPLSSPGPGIPDNFHSILSLPSHCR